MDEREAANRSIRDYLERARKRLADGRAELDRQRASVDDTREHLSGMSRWIAEQGGVRPMPSDE
jgi:hypothetical protein